MFAIMAAAAQQRTQELFLQNGMSEAAIRDHEIQKNSDMIDFCTTTYSSIRNREYCIDVSATAFHSPGCLLCWDAVLRLYGALGAPTQFRTCSV
jgi:hypothetical protein